MRKGDVRKASVTAAVPSYTAEPYQTLRRGQVLSSHHLHYSLNWDRARILDLREL